MLKNFFTKIIAIVLFISISGVILWFLWNFMAQSVLVSFYSTFWAPVSSYEYENSIGFFPDSQNPPRITKKDLGEISPLSGTVSIIKDYSALGKDSTEPEYLYLVANIHNKKPVNISGMILQSMVTGNAAIIPQGAKLYTLGKVNPVADIFLNPGEAAIIYTNTSPLSVSFRENKCSGYLNALSDFNPKLPTLLCPKAKSIIPNTIENIKKYGDACMDVINSMPKCGYFLTDHPKYDKVSNECRTLLANELTYNACVARFADNKNFFFKGGKWRIYLERNGTLWKNKYEVIKLMDKDGKTVFVMSY